jgi:hypothetical protein
MQDSHEPLEWKGINRLENMRYNSVVNEDIDAHKILANKKPKEKDELRKAVLITTR